MTLYPVVVSHHRPALRLLPCDLCSFWSHDKHVLSHLSLAGVLLFVMPPRQYYHHICISCLTTYRPSARASVPVVAPHSLSCAFHLVTASQTLLTLSLSILHSSPDPNPNCAPLASEKLISGIQAPLAERCISCRFGTSFRKVGRFSSLIPEARVMVISRWSGRVDRYRVDSTSSFSVQAPSRAVRLCPLQRARASVRREMGRR